MKFVDIFQKFTDLLKNFISDRETSSLLEEQDASVKSLFSPINEDFTHSFSNDEGAAQFDPADYNRFLDKYLNFNIENHTPLNDEYFLGTNQDDYFKGNYEDENIERLEGDDPLVRSDGDDILTWGGDEDHLYRESGEDIVPFSEESGEVDLSSLKGIGSISLEGDAATVLTVTSKDIFDLGASNNTLVIDGGVEDRITLDEAGWVRVGENIPLPEGVKEDEGYQTYIHELSGAILQVNMDVIVTLGEG